RLNDLLQLDHRQFWAERLLMRTVDLTKLGRLHCVHMQGVGPLRGPWIEHVPGLTIPFDYHARTGAALWLTCGSKEETWATMQALIDDCRRKWRDNFPISRCVEQLDVRHLLPTEQV